MRSVEERIEMSDLNVRTPVSGQSAPALWNLMFTWRRFRRGARVSPVNPIAMF
jgi:hypothetical protein